MFVHGRWSANRLSNFLILFFHKNFGYTIPQFWFGIYNGMSAQTVWAPWYLSMYSTLVTSLAIGGFAIWNQDVAYNSSQDRKLIDLLNPFLYVHTKEKEKFGVRRFLVWNAIAITQSYILFDFNVRSYTQMNVQDGKDHDMWAVN
mmetsp:Transcript_30493/g.29889  ORF Transcript_30493/g.29889 Transcript_30493/m.29889 type:complete len:145 (+) Transcript_30493:2422-2856(+)